ncbi:glycosyltransferase [[Clostridium] innocuum]|nr:glycosyltransferase [[Clostridium] innocuum]
MIESGLVSIIMPAYNSAQYIDESIQSVLNQTYLNWELIIVDDCSSDDTDIVIQKYLVDKRIIYLKNKQNSGAAISRNKALIKAKGKWIAFLDSDDVWLPSKLKEQIDFMLNNDYKFSYTDYRIRENDEWLPYIYTGPNIVTKRKMYNYCYFSTITVMYDREFVGLIQIEDLKKNNDYAMWLQIIDKTPCYRLGKCLSYYYKHDDSISSGSKFKLIKHHYILFKVGLGKNSFISFILTLNNLFWGMLKKIKYREVIK